MSGFVSQHHALIALRAMVGIIMMAHGFQRLYYGTVGNFSDFLNSKGLVIGAAIAWGITVFELVGGASLIAGYFKRWICLAWMVVIVAGILLVHLQNGWYVVGPSTGGVEDSLLILVCLLVLAADSGKSKTKI